MGELVGKFVWLERKPPIDKNRSNYYDGEYFVVKETPHSVHVVKPEGGYGGHEAKTFGKCEYNIHDPYADVAAARDFIADLDHFSRTLDRGEKAQWVEYVYSRAKATARLARRALSQLDVDECTEEKCCSDEDSDVYPIQREVVVRIVIES